MEEYEVIRIPVSDGTEKEFAIMDTFTVEEKHYMAVSLIEEDEIQEGVYLYRYRGRRRYRCGTDYGTGRA